MEVATRLNMEDKLDVMLIDDNSTANLIPFYLNNPYPLGEIDNLVMNTGPGNKQKWLYQTPTVPLYNCGRNEPCPCESGKKHKNVVLIKLSNGRINLLEF